MTELIEKGRANSTETYQRTKYPTNSMTKLQRLDEIEDRRRREHDLFMQEQTRENQRIYKMKVEKNKE